MDQQARRILIADDNRDIHEDIRYILDSAQETRENLLAASKLKAELFGADSDGEKKLGLSIRYRIDDAYQGEEAVALVEKACRENDPYALVFMDVRMPPGMDGIEAIEKIWQIDPDVSVVIATAYSDYSWDQIVSSLGQNDSLLFMKKPFDNVAVKQIALAMTTKWDLQKQVKRHIDQLEDKVRDRTNELTLMVRQLKDEITLRKEKEKQLAYSAHYDSLTGLLNRRSFYEALSILSDDRHKQPAFAIFYIDLDGFKSVNDIFGHDTGDLLLQEVASRIDQTMQGQAYPVPDYLHDDQTTKSLFRLGGDEFTAIVASEDQDRLSALAENVIAAIKRPFILEGSTIDSSCSIGISIYHKDNLPLNTLLKHADVALYQAKRENGTYRFYSQEESKKYLDDLRLEKDLYQAIEDCAFEVHYQPLVNSRGKPIGMQALVRWQHPEFGWLQPQRFLPIAEKNNRIFKLGQCVLDKALSDMASVHDVGFAKFFVMVSCTVKEFYHPDFARSVKEKVRQSRLSPDKLKLCLDDDAPFKATPAALAIIDELHEFGIKFVINGFENDYSTFLFLQQVPRDTIVKLDKGFVKNIADDRRNCKFLMSLIDIIQNWELDVIINGIETQEQKKMLETKDCILQGYHYHKPQPLSDFLTDLEQGMNLPD